MFSWHPFSIVAEQHMIIKDSTAAVRHTSKHGLSCNFSSSSSLQAPGLVVLLKSVKQHFPHYELVQASADMYSMRSREYDVARGSKYIPLPQGLHLQSILNDQGRTPLAYLLRNMSLSKQARKHTFQESWEEKYFCCTQDDNIRCLLCSIVQKGTHKWNIKRYYDTVLCSKSAADAANLSIFTSRHVHYGLRCTTSF